MYPRDALALALVLAAVAGFADSHVYLHIVEVFPANMSGNLVGIGMFPGSGQWGDAGLSVLAVVCFVFGVVIANAVQRVRNGPSDVLLVCEAALLSALAALVIVVDPRILTSPGWIDVPVVALGALAMGAQCIALRSIAGTPVTTTYETGALVRIGKTVSAPRHDPHRGTTAALLGVIITSYVLGALVAALIGASPWWMLVPAVAIWGAAAWARHHQLRPHV